MRDVGVDPTPITERSLIERTRPFVWGFASQAASSATNLGLSILAASLLGPAGLGKVFIGFSAYLLALGFQRALITDPYVAASSTVGKDQQAEATAAALTTCLLGSVLGTILVGTAALVAGGAVGDGLMLFVPWLIPALIQDFWRVVLFRDGRGSAAITNDVIWVAVMGLLIPLSIVLRSEWAVVGGWGLGALGGAILGLVQTRVRPLRARRSMNWWQRHAWPLGKWLGGEGVIYAIGSQGVVFVLAYVLSVHALGGIRAVQTLFAPLSLLIPAIVLPGLPQMSRHLATSTRAARRFAVLLGGATAGITFIYVLIGISAGRWILTLVFGQEFQVFGSLILPVAVGQLLVGSAVGFILLLKARMQGKALLTSRLVASVATFVFASGLAVTHGVEGAVWGMAIGAAANSLLVSLWALRPPRRAEDQAGA